MFKKTYNSVKCKTALGVSLGRIKLLQNKKQAQIQMLRREVANLLASKKEESARIRVEGVMREAAMVNVLEILDLFCDLLSVRERQLHAAKECPLDLKEAAATLVFVAVRSTELPELNNVKEQLALKFGPEFISKSTTDATALSFGVNQIVVEKMAIVTPSPSAKLALLREIAEEHQVDWDAQAATTNILGPAPQDFLDIACEVGDQPSSGVVDPFQTVAVSGGGGGASHHTPAHPVYSLGIPTMHQPPPVVDVQQKFINAAGIADRAVMDAYAAAAQAGVVYTPPGMPNQTPAPQQPVPPPSVTATFHANPITNVESHGKPHDDSIDCKTLDQSLPDVGSAATDFNNDTRYPGYHEPPPKSGIQPTPSDTVPKSPDLFSPPPPTHIGSQPPPFLNSDAALPSAPPAPKATLELDDDYQPLPSAPDSSTFTGSNDKPDNQYIPPTLPPENSLDDLTKRFEALKRRH